MSEYIYGQFGTRLMRYRRGDRQPYTRTPWENVPYTAWEQSAPHLPEDRPETPVGYRWLYTSRAGASIYFVTTWIKEEYK